MAHKGVFARLQDSADCRVCFTLIGFVYSPIALLIGAAAVIGIG